MDKCATVKVKHPTDPAGYMVINESDLRSDHVVIDGDDRAEACNAQPAAPKAHKPKRSHKAE